MSQIRHKKVYSPIEDRRLSYQYLDAPGIMRRCGVSRATAYRYLKAIGNDEKLLIFPLMGKPRLAALIPSVDRIHARMERGNPACKDDPLHQRNAAAARWRGHDET